MVLEQNQAKYTVICVVANRIIVSVANLLFNLLESTFNSICESVSLCSIDILLATRVDCEHLLKNSTLENKLHVLSAKVKNKASLSKHEKTRTETVASTCCGYTSSAK